MDIELLYYKSLPVQFVDGTPYMTQAAMGAMLGIKPDSVGESIRRVTEYGFVDAKAMAISLMAESRDGVQRELLHYPLEVIMLVGFRVQTATPQAIAFQRWTVEIVKGYIRRLEEELESMKLVIEGTYTALEQSRRIEQEGWERYALAAYGNEPAYWGQEED